MWPSGPPLDETQRTRSGEGCETGTVGGDPLKQADLAEEPRRTLLSYSTDDL